MTTINDILKLNFQRISILNTHKGWILVFIFSTIDESETFLTFLSNNDFNLKVVNNNGEVGFEIFFDKLNESISYNPRLIKKKYPPIMMLANGLVEYFSAGTMNGVEVMTTSNFVFPLKSRFNLN